MFVDPTDFTQRIASLERSLGNVASSRNKYLYTLPTAAAPSTDPSNTAQFSEVGDFVDYSAYGAPKSASFYDPRAAPQAPSLKVPQASQKLRDASRVSFIDDESEPTDGSPQGLSPYSTNNVPAGSSSSTCPRCSHIQHMEESLAVVEENYKSEIDHLRDMLGNVDADRLDVVARFEMSQADVDTLRFQLLEKEKLIVEWRQRCVMAEEALGSESRRCSALRYEQEGRVQFVLQQMVMMLIGVEGAARAESSACEFATRTAIWSEMSSSLLQLQRQANLAKFHKDQAEVAMREMKLREAEFRLAQQQIQQQPEHRSVSATSAQQALRAQGPSSAKTVVIQGLPQFYNLAVMSSENNTSRPLSSGCHPLANNNTSNTVNGLAALVGSMRSDVNLMSQSDGESLGGPVKTLCLTGVPGAVPQLPLTLPADDMSFGDLEVDEVTMQQPLTTLQQGPPSSSQFQSPVSAASSSLQQQLNQPALLGDDGRLLEIKKWQQMLADSETARRQLEGHLMTEQQYSNEMQAELDDLLQREFELQEHTGRLRIELMESLFRNELSMQVNRRWLGQITALQAAKKSMLANSASSSSVSTAAPTSNSVIDERERGLLQKELSVLRKLYTEAKEESFMAKKELAEFQERVEMEKVNFGSISLPTVAPQQRSGSTSAQQHHQVANMSIMSSSGLMPDTPNMPISVPKSLVTTPVRLPSPSNVQAVPIATLPPAAVGVVDTEAIAAMVAERLQSQFATLIESIDNIRVQLTLPPVAVVEEGGGANPLSPDLPSDASPTSSATVVLPRDASKTFCSSSSVLHDSASVPPPGYPTKPSSFAQMLLERVQSATRMHHESILSTIEQSIRLGEERLIAIQSKAIPASTPPPRSPAPAVNMPTKRPKSGAASDALDNLSDAELLPPSHVSPSSGDIDREQLGLAQLQDALASIRKIVRVTLYSTSHNQKIVGEKLDEISIAQKALMGEIRSSTSQLSGGPSGFFSPSAEESHHAALAAYSFPPALQAIPKQMTQLTAEEQDRVIREYVAEQQRQNGGAVLSPPAPPLPHFSSPQVSAPLNPPKADASPTSSKRKQSHRWDEDEDDHHSPVKAAQQQRQPSPAVAATAAVFHPATKKTPYDDDTD